MAVRVETKPMVGAGIRWPGVSLGLVLALGLLVNRLSLWGNRLAQLKERLKPLNLEIGLPGFAVHSLYGLEPWRPHEL